MIFHVVIKVLPDENKTQLLNMGWFVQQSRLLRSLRVWKCASASENAKGSGSKESEWTYFPAKMEMVRGQRTK